MLSSDVSAHLLTMGLPIQPVSLSAEQIDELNRKLSTMRHDINNNLSLIMKRLTGVTVLLAGIGAIAGIFGMSEAGTAFAGGEALGFWLVTIFTVAVASGAALVLRRIDWI